MELGFTFGDRQRKQTVSYRVASVSDNHSNELWFERTISRYVTPSTLRAGPLRVSAPAQPAYFETAAGQMVYLLVRHTWSNLQTRTGDPPAVFQLHRRIFISWLLTATTFSQETPAVERGSRRKDSRIAFRPIWFIRGPYQRPDGEPDLDGSRSFDLRQFKPDYFRPRAQTAPGWPGSPREVYFLDHLFVFDGGRLHAKAGPNKRTTRGRVPPSIPPTISMDKW